MIENITISFIYKGNVASISVISKFTYIVGIDSGEGKTEFLSVIEDYFDKSDFKIIVEPKVNIAIANNANIDTLLKSDIRSIYIIDEALVNDNVRLKQMNKSKHLFICVNRSLPTSCAYAYGGIYLLNRTENWYNIVKVNGLRLYHIGVPIDTIITEAAPLHSENELLSVYNVNLVSANGRDNLHAIINNHKNERLLVLADLGNISGAYKILAKRCRDIPQLYFYDYQCLEELLFKSKLVNGDDSAVPIKSTDLISIENYYETVLELSTHGTYLEYKHGKHLNPAYLDTNNFEQLLNTKVGSGLYNLIKECDFEPYTYLKARIGDKADLLATALVNDCTTKEDCDNLIQNSKHLWETW